MTTVFCPHGERCSGCDYLGEDYPSQLQRKSKWLMGLLEESSRQLEILAPAASGLRDRLDFQIRDQAVGLFAKQEREIVDIETCAQQSPALAAWYHDFRQHPFPLRTKASVRLRVSPQGARGLWIDLANIDVKSLLDEQKWLTGFLEQGIVIEIGQRRKRLVQGPDRLRLEDPTLLPWFQTRWREHIVELFGAVGSFTQPSHAANEVISRWMQSRVQSVSPQRIVELGSGQGNLSFPALSSEAHLVACESDRLALDGFRQSLDVLAQRGIDLRDRVEIRAGDFLKKPSEALEGADMLLANPPRSGLGRMLDSLATAKDLRAIIYMSCHPEGLAEDAPRLRSCGFQMKEWALLDQFPQTRHMEVLSLWVRA